jgi:3-hydroxybutyryl-CoA dehydrogenase
MEIDMPECVAVLGIGQMGSSAAACFYRAGLPVLVWARDAAKLKDAEPRIIELKNFLDRHEGTPDTAAGTLTLTSDLRQVNDAATVVLECIAEDLAQKSALLSQLAPAASGGAVLASCTSGLSISAMGRQSGVGRRLIGAHFWNPAHLMPLVEVVRGDETDDGLVERMCALLNRAGKIAVACKDIPGFIGNRLFHALFREAAFLVEQGVCSPETVDLVARLTFALRLPAVGPCENMDLVGLELIEQIQSYLLADLCDSKQSLPVIRSLLAQGRAGMKTGRGFYDWGRRDPRELLAQRDEQIARQIKFLKEIGRCG